MVNPPTIVTCLLLYFSAIYTSLKCSFKLALLVLYTHPEREREREVIPKVPFLPLLLEDEVDNGSHEKLVDDCAHQKEQVDA